MKIRHLEFSVVLVANDHNPTILNPDFLALRDIVPAGWGWKLVGHAITTPPFATVAYDSGVTIIIQPNSLQVSDNSGKAEPSSKPIEIARTYVEVLPHVRYSAVGINFRSVAEQAEAEAFLKHRFLKSGPWDSESYKLQGFGLKLVYPLDSGRLVLSLDSAIVPERSEGQTQQTHGVIVYANFHRDCQGYPTDKQIIEHLAKADRDWTFYKNTLSKLLDDTPQRIHSA